MVWIFLGVLLMIPLTAVIAGVVLSGPRYRGPRSDHFDGRRFINPGGAKAAGGGDVLKWMLNRRRGAWPEDLSEQFGKRPLGHFKDGIRVTFVNHSTFLIQVAGVNILTDPIWSRRASPVSWAGPKRMRLPGIRFGDLPRIHLVLVSHNHYDHLDMQTMRMLHAAHHPRFITPLGIKRFLDEQYISGTTEADWWEELDFNEELSIQLVPAQHFSGRGLLDRDATLWSGFVIKTPMGSIYYAGDTGYNQALFQDIGKRCGPFKLSMLPVGAYLPRWFMSPIHASPEQAVAMHKDVRSELSVAMHYGTFPLADDGMDDAPSDLKKVLESQQLSADSFLLLKEGEPLVIERKAT